MMKKIWLISIILIFAPSALAHGKGDMSVGPNIGGSLKQVTPSADICTLDVVDCYDNSVAEKIKLYANNPKAALRIATCESQLGKFKRNWGGSSAYGLFQFTKTTWQNYCEGSIKDDVAQIKCFNKLYPKHKSWWQCK